MNEQAISLVVNAGGQSRRMGRNKALLPVPPDQIPLVEYIARRLAPLVTDRIVVVTNTPEVARIAVNLERSVVLADRWATGGALGGIATGLSACAGWAMVVACDMPLADVGVFARLQEEARRHPDVDAIIPHMASQAEPFHGLWHRRALAKLEASLLAGELGIQKVLASLDVLWLDEVDLGVAANSMAFYNVNTPEDWDRLLAYLREQKRPVA